MKKPKPLSTPLSECLLFDPTSPGGAIHDLDPFGSYLTGEAGTVVFKQALRAAPVFTRCGNVDALDALLFRVFLAVAKNTKRFLVTSYEGGDSLLRHRVDGKLFSGGALKVNTSRIDEALGARGLAPEGKSLTHVNALPDNIVIAINGEPEEVGRLCYFDGSGTQSSNYGISILDPWRIAVIQLLPKPTFPLSEIL
jgi:hypothetical protein